MAMRTLDCHDLESTLTSLAGLLSIQRLELEASLRSFPPDQLEADPNLRCTPAPRVVWNHVLRLDAPVPIPEITYWFHATRVPAGTDFRDGIQPLGERVEQIKKSLVDLKGQLCLPDERDPANSVFRVSGGRHYALKIPNKLHWGPYAFLVRAAIVHRGSFTHDYLGAPEIVEDLAGMLAGDSAPDLLEAFQRVTKRCIVKFRSAQPREDVVRVALFYCYRTLWGQEHTIDTNTNFDGGGRTIGPEDIVVVEYLD